MYVYGLFKKKDNATLKDLFYVGITKNIIDRALSHSYEKSRNIKNNYIKKYGLNIKLLFITSTREEACEREIFLISYFGRMMEKTGQLSNVTAGGEANPEWPQEMKDQIAEKLSKIKKHQQAEFVEKFRTESLNNSVNFTQFCKDNNLCRVGFRKLLIKFGIETEGRRSLNKSNHYNKLIEEYEICGLSKNEFCKQNNISREKFKCLLYRDRPDLIKPRCGIAYSKETKNNFIEDFMKSGLNKTNFCQQNKLNIKAFSEWIKKYKPSLCENKRYPELNEQQRIDLLLKYKESALSMKDFCLENNISSDSLYTWFKLYNIVTKRPTIKHNNESKEKIYEEYIKSGLTNKKFCEINNINPYLLRDIKKQKGISRKSVKRTDEEKLKIYTDFKESGLSQAAFCRLINLDKTVFNQDIVKKFKQQDVGLK